MYCLRPTADHTDYTPNGDGTSLYSGFQFYDVISPGPNSLSEVQDYKNYNSFDLSHDFPYNNTNYSSNYNDEYNAEFYDHKEPWRRKPVKQWENTEVLKWINSEAENMGICCTDINGPEFCKLDGFRLMEMGEADFEKCDQKFGKKLYERFKKFISIQEPLPLAPMMTPNNCSYDQTYTNLDISSSMDYSKNDSYDADITQVAGIANEKNRPFSANNTIRRRKNQTNNEVPLDGERRKGPGRPKLQRKKKKPEKKVGRLWEFIRDLLKNRDYCPKIICWENHDEGMFRFVHSDKVAKLWGKKKDNPEMNYEKLSRAMRYYYRSDVLQAVIGRRLVYKFGPNAVGWRCDNPNFKN